MRHLLTAFSLLIAVHAWSQEIAVMQYDGGGDWYVNPTSLPNLIAFCNDNIHTKINPEPEVVKPSSPNLYRYPFIHLTGHGNVVFSDYERNNLRTYLESGGFLHIDDNYGMDPYIRRELALLFPDIALQEIPNQHAIFHQVYKFPNGLPKIHEHDGLPPQAFGIFIEDRLALLYTYETDLGNGWEDQAVHNDPQEVRLKALQMGANIIHYVFNN